MKTILAGLLVAVAAAPLHVALAPEAAANICREVGSGRYYNADECPVGSVATAEAWDEVRQRAEGLPPCYADGVPFYTPTGTPCP